MTPDTNLAIPVASTARNLRFPKSLGEAPITGRQLMSVSGSMRQQIHHPIGPDGDVRAGTSAGVQHLERRRAASASLAATGSVPYATGKVPRPSRPCLS